MNLTIEDVEKLATILGFFLIFCGVIKIYTYYKVFNLTILPYLKITEILSLFLENVMAFLLVAIFVGITSLDFFYKINIDGAGFNLLLNLDFAQRIRLILMQINLSYWFFGISTLAFFFFYLLRKNINKYEFIISIPLFLGYIIIPIITVLAKIQLKDWYGLELKIIFVFFCFLLLSLILFSIANALNEAYKVKKHQFFKNAVFIFDDNEKIISNQYLYYIGRTEGFIFFYNSRNEKPIIIPASRLKKNYSR
ncbi:MAG: hypothetical protein ACO1OF_06745 [Adhaeribacter sp.]